MKPKKIKPKIVYRIIHKATGTAGYKEGHQFSDDTYDFDSIFKARDADFYREFKDKDKYNIAKYRVIYELIDDNCDNKNPKN